MKIKHNRSRVDVLTEAKIEFAAFADPDAQPLARERLTKLLPLLVNEPTNKGIRLTTKTVVNDPERKWSSVCSLSPPGAAEPPRGLG